jgi:hypothetical protein
MQVLYEFRAATTNYVIQIYVHNSAIFVEEYLKGETQSDNVSTVELALRHFAIRVNQFLMGVI